MRMVFGLALRQTEGLIGPAIGLLRLDLAVPDHSTLSRRSKTLEVSRLRRAGTGPLYLLVDSTGLKLGGAGEWLIEKHGTSCCRCWRKLHIGVDAASGEIVAVAMIRKDIDDAAMVGALLDQIADPIGSFTAEGAYDQDQVSLWLPSVIQTPPSSCSHAPARWRVRRPNSLRHSVTVICG
jgi:Transposase DDE domain